MRFETPSALWGLLSLVLLVLFSLWRQPARRVSVPSLALWKRIAERNPPVRALRRPRWRLELLLQALGIAAAVLALAGPFRQTDERKPLRVGFVFDTSARMRAAGRLDQARARAAELRQGPFRGDTVTCYAALPSPESFPDPARVAPVDVHVDLDPLLAAARAASDRVVLFSDRPRDGADLELRAAPADNVGIVDFSVTGEEIFVRLVNHGPPRPIPLELEVGDRKIRDVVPAGTLRWFRKGEDLSNAQAVRVTLLGGDSFATDDVAEADRLASLETPVSLSGRIPPQLVKALRSIPGVSVRMGAAPAKLAVGVDAAPGPGDLRVWLVAPAAPWKGREVRVKPNPLTVDLEKRPRELASVLGPLPAEDRGGEPLITVDGDVALSLKGRDVRLAVDVAEWGKGLVSLPIFFANAVDVARQGASGWTVVRTGRPVLLPAGSRIEKAPPGAVWSLSPEGWFVASTVGTYGLRTPEGPRTLRANLLDERESDTVGVTRSLDERAVDPAGRERVRHPLAGPAAALALGLLGLAWIMQRRSE